MKSSSKLIFIGSNLVLVSKLGALKDFEVQIIKPKSLKLGFDWEASLNDVRIVLVDLEACRKDGVLDVVSTTAERCCKSQIKTIAFFPHVYSEYKELEGSFDHLVVKGSVMQALKKLLATSPRTYTL